MSAQRTRAASAFDRLPASLRPLDAELPGGERRRKLEIAVLVLLALVLCVAVVHDITRQVKINYRLTADIESWREITGHNFKNVAIEQDAKHYTKHDVACANVSFALPGTRTQICFVMVGPIIKDRRATHAGFFLPPHRSDRPRNRYGCFGVPMARYPCKLATPPGAFHTPPASFGPDGWRPGGR